MSQEEKESTPPQTSPDAYHYPEQRHAGAVGLGPEYGKGAVRARLTPQSIVLQS